MTESDRDKTIEVMARAACKRTCQAERRKFKCWCIGWRARTANMEAALTAYESHLRASGMAVVPVAYTPQMFEAGDRVLEDDGGPGEIWQAMLAASPSGKPVVKEKDDE